MLRLLYSHGRKAFVKGNVFMSRAYSAVLTTDSMNSRLKEMEYAVRGPVPQRALVIKELLAKGETFPFHEVIDANIGDAHAMGQKPISFVRQVLAVCMYPDIPRTTFPADVFERAERILASCGGRSIGAYSDSVGIDILRQDVCDYLKERDGVPVDQENVFLCAGASAGIRVVLAMLMERPGSQKRTGVLTPVPQYPLYSATLTEYGAHTIDYYLDEDNSWALDLNAVQKRLDRARDVSDPWCMVVINPGNPTGQVLSRRNMEDVIKFCYDNNLFLLADEVYQDNVYNSDRPAFSFKKILNGMIETDSKYNSFQMAAFDSTSKGYLGECGFRGGFMEFVGLDEGTLREMKKVFSAKLCPSLPGQIAMSIEVRPPEPGNPSYNLFKKERDAVLNSLGERAKMTTTLLNEIEGVKCNAVDGSMYAFPRVNLPQKAIEEAKKAGMEPDVFYCFQLLESKGVSTVPGSGFGQLPGTHHFRTTILPPPAKLRSMLLGVGEFHRDFMKKFC